ncbi:MarR family winged helix-turn-helix transcriptional regulator [Nocardia sp. NPDC127526]|uniref:MarR family winged helix-turn-helix transcriptional regulator n=1 Tax=Nocardia sp. NPDC127526 TaxID=3345393 RepID=UPI00362E028A
MPDDSPTPDEVWRMLTTLVMDSRDVYRRAVIERTGLPFSRIRILRRLRGGPLTVKELAHAATMDAPAATVAITDLEERGLVVREIDAANRRRKLVSLTDTGREVVATALATPDPAPPRVTELSAGDLRTLRDLLHKLEH